MSGSPIVLTLHGFANMFSPTFHLAAPRKGIKLISEEVILSLNYHKDVHDKLKQHGIEPIYCRFRHRNFWDGGLHCLTLDTVREGGMQDYFK